MSAQLEMVIRRIAEEVAARMAQPRAGKVVAVNPHPPTPVVKVQWDEGDPTNGVQPSQSGWLPLSQVAAGNGWAVVTLPNTGDQVFCVPHLGDHGSMVVAGSVHSELAPAPQVMPYMASTAVPLVPGERTLIHASGASLRLTASGIESRGLWKHDGDFVASGDVSDQNQRHGSLNLLRSDYNQHGHPGVKSGGDTTGPTNAPTP